MKNHIHYTEVVSTNTLLKEMLLEDASLPHFMVVSADYQTSGRGQRENKWESEQEANLLFSLLLRPEELKATDAFAISRIVSVAIVKWLAKYVGNVSIKWPNDIYCGDKKICGILIENSIMGSNLSTAIIGVGININQTSFSQFIPNPTSLQIETRNAYNTQEMLSEVLSEIELRYNAYFNGESEKINSLYHNLLYRLNTLAKFRIPVLCDSGTRVCEATIIGVETNGCLMLKHTEGEVCRYAFKEVEFII